jgi:hypothetical protein
MMGRMARFLSEEWFALVGEALSGPEQQIDVTDGASGSVAVRHRVTGGPDGDVDYVVRARSGRFSMEKGAEGPVDIEVVESYESAAAISQGVVTPAEAFAAGELKLEGDVALLAARQEDFVALAALLAPVRAVTTH